MLSSQKLRKYIIIQKRLLLIQFHNQMMTMETTDENLLSNQIYSLQIQEIPENLIHCFNSVRHIYNYLTNHPQNIYSFTESIIVFMINVNGSFRHIHFNFMRLEINEAQILLKYKVYRLNVINQKKQKCKKDYEDERKKLLDVLNELRKAVFQEQAGLNLKRKKFQLLAMQKQAKSQEKIHLQKTLKNKQQMLTQIKLLQGILVTIDD